MRESKQNIAIAESVDPKTYTPGTGVVIKGDAIWIIQPHSQSDVRCPITCPPYTTDLNAIRRAILTKFNSGAGFTFIDNLRRACGVKHDMLCMAMIVPSATQLCEAYLRTIYKWEAGE